MNGTLDLDSLGLVALSKAEAKSANGGFWGKFFRFLVKHVHIDFPKLPTATAPGTSTPSTPPIV